MRITSQPIVAASAVNSAANRTRPTSPTGTGRKKAPNSASSTRGGIARQKKAVDAPSTPATIRASGSASARRAACSMKPLPMLMKRYLSVFGK